MKCVAIIDYGLGNVDSVARAVRECGGEPLITGNPAEIRTASSMILPGVGSFPDGMRELKQRGLDGVLRHEAIEEGIPLLGICLGMQLLATTGFEGGETPGLDLVPGEVRRLEPAARERVPHVGWNEVNHKADCPLFESLSSGKDFYFVHSYHLTCANPEHMAAQTPYCGEFVSCVQSGPVFGTQFHPEKSQKPGLQLLRNFLAL